MNMTTFGSHTRFTTNSTRVTKNGLTSHNHFDINNYLKFFDKVIFYYINKSYLILDIQWSNPKNIPNATTQVKKTLNRHGKIAKKQ